MTTTEFPWGTVTHTTDPETGDTSVEITVETEESTSLSVTTAPDAANDRLDEVADTEPDAETATFPWGAVIHAVNPDTETTSLEVIIDAEADVSVSVRAISDGETYSESTTVVQSSGETKASTSVTRSVASETSSTANSVVTTSSTSYSQLTSGSSGTSIDIDDEDDD